MAFRVNYSISLYKGLVEQYNQTTLTRNRCRVEAAGLNEALERITRDTINAREQKLAIFEGRILELEARLRHFSNVCYLAHLRHTGPGKGGLQACR